MGVRVTHFNSDSGLEVLCCLYGVANAVLIQHGVYHAKKVPFPWEVPASRWQEYQSLGPVLSWLEDNATHQDVVLSSPETTDLYTIFSPTRVLAQFMIQTCPVPTESYIDRFIVPFKVYGLDWAGVATRAKELVYDVHMTAETWNCGTWVRPERPLLDAPEAICTTNMARGVLSVLDGADLEEIASVDLGFEQLTDIAALQGEKILVVSEQGWIAVLDSDRNIVRKVQLPVIPQGMSLDRTKNILAIGSGSGTLVTLNIETLEVLKQRLVSVYSCGVDIDPKGNRIFMPRTLLGDLLVFDEDTLETIARIPLEPGVRVVRYITDRQIAVVGNYLNGKLYLVDTEDYRVIDTLWVGCKIRSIQYAPTRDRLYISTALRILEVHPNKL